MKDRKQAYFCISGEALLEMIREKFIIPDDAELVEVHVNNDPKFIDIKNTTRFIVKSDVFQDVYMGQTIPRFIPDPRNNVFELRSDNVLDLMPEGETK